MWYYYFDVDKTAQYLQRRDPPEDGKHSDILRQVEPDPGQGEAGEEDKEPVRNGCRGGITKNSTRYVAVAGAFLFAVSFVLTACHVARLRVLRKDL